MSQILVRNLGWDRSSRFFRFKNNWHYLFSGEILEFKESDVSIDTEINFRTIDVIVQVGNDPVIYTGVLSHYDLSVKGMERIYLRQVSRRFFSEKQETDKKPFKLPGDLLVVPFNKILNLHITYYQLQNEEDGSNQSSFKQSE